MEAFGTRMRGGLATMLSVALIVSGALLAAPAANAEEVTPSGKAAVTEAPVNEAPVTEAPASDAPAEEAPVAEAPAKEAPAADASAPAAPEAAPHVAAPASTDALAARAPAPAPASTASVQAVSTDGLTVHTEVAGVDPSSQPIGVHIGVVLRGTADGAEQADFLGGTASVKVIPDSGKFSADVAVHVDQLDRSEQYEVVIWPRRSNPIATNIVMVLPFDVTDGQWDEVFPQIPAGPSVVAEVTAASDAGLEVSVQLDDVVIPTGKFGAYVGVIEKDRVSEYGTDSGAGMLEAYLGTKSFVEGSASVDIVVSPEKKDRKTGEVIRTLDRTKQYVVVSWLAHGFLTDDVKVAQEDLVVTDEQWDEVFPAPAGPTLKASVTGVSDAGLQISVQLDGVAIPTGKFGAYVGVIEKDRVSEYGTDAGAGMLEAYLGTKSFVEGSASVDIVVSPEKKDRKTGEVIRTLDRTKQYVVVSWLAHGFLTDEVKVAQQDLVVTDEQWDEVFPAPAGPTLKASVTGVSDDGLQISVQLDGVVIPTGKFGAYVGVIEKDRVSEYGTDAGAGMHEAYLGTKSFVEGSASVDVVVSQEKKDRKTGEVIRTIDRSKQYVVVSWLAHGFLTDEVKVAQQDLAVTDAQWDKLAGITPPVEQPGTDPKPFLPSAGSLTWGVSTPFANYVTGSISKGTIATSGVGGGRGGYVFPQVSASSWNAETRTGTVAYSGSVTFIGHDGLMRETFSNPVITVNSPISGTISTSGYSFPLNLVSAGFTANADGSVTWSNVSVSGVISGGDGGGAGGELSVDSLSFTVGSASGLNFGSTTTTSPFAQVRTAAATPPAATGLTVVTPAAKLVAGGEVEITAGGFEPNEQGILVVIYSEPTVLDTNAKADKDGVVRWIGKLPKDLTGKHTLTLQGSISVGQEITIAAADSLKKAVKPAAAPVVSGEMQTASALPDMGAPAWIWWVSALALLVIAGASTGLVVAQRRKNDTPDRL